MSKILKPLASLRLTVVLFVLSIVLVFFGTLALIDNGMWTVIDSYFRSGVVWINFDLIRKFLVTFFWFPPSQTSWPGSVPFPGGVSIAVLLLINMTAAHVVRFKFTWNRAGIIILHSGLIMLLGGELITRYFAVEQKMTIKVGEKSHYTMVTEEPELAITRTADGEEIVHTISQRALLRSLNNKKSIAVEGLPFEISVNQHFKNTKMTSFEPGMTPLKDAQFARNLMGTTFELTSTPEASGTKSGDNIPSLTVTLSAPSASSSLGTFFLSYLFDRDITRRLPVYHFPPQTVEVDGVTYRIEYRPKRIYKPYTIALKDFTHEKYPGTDKPKDFRSTVQLVHPERGENREVKIWMNNPLRYDSLSSKSVMGAIKSLNPVWNESETFFQSGYFPEGNGTILQVVQNPSWMWPYISCILITLGMLIHFLMVLTKFVQRSIKMIKSQTSAVAEAPIVDRPVYAKFWPIAIGVGIALLTGGWLLSKYRLPKSPEGQIDLVAFGSIPVLDGGRVQPLDSFARNLLTALTDSESYQAPRTDEEVAAIGAGERFLNTLRSVDGKTKSRPATEWLLQVLGTRDAFESEGAKLRIFRIDSLDVIDFLGLERRPGNYRYSPAELKPSYPKFKEQYEKVRRIEPEDRDLFQKRIFELGNKIAKYESVVFLDAPLMLPPAQGSKDWTNFRNRDEELVRPALEEQLSAMVRAINESLIERDKRFAQAENPIALLPPEARQELINMILNRQAKLRKSISDEKLPKDFPEGHRLIQMLDAGRKGDTAEFARQIEEHKATLTQLSSGETNRVATEHKVNAFDPFLNCMVLFVFSFLIGTASWLFWEFPRVRLTLWTTALGLLIVTLAVQIFAMALRMYLMDRMGVFVTNLYGSAVFIGTCVSLICIPLEIFNRLGIGTVVASSLGFATTYIARHLQSTGDTLAMVEAVLDTNLWLSTHVTTVTFGYAATLMAGAIALLYLGLSSCTTILKGQNGKTVAGMVYGTICFATLLSFVGTVLGGIWADQSWGRFWGWDPKENGALLIVAWNALILHARWAGLVKARGVAILAIAGISITMWSWFGTNQLGIGLHSYGFSNTLASWCTWTWIASIFLTGLFMTIPESIWRSRSAT